MIKIKKGKDIITVSKGTYETMFKSLGYSIVDEAGETKKVSSANQKSNNSEKNIVNSSENKNKDILSNELNNLSNKEEKSENSKSDDKLEEKKEESNNSEKDNGLEKILGMLSDNSKENLKSNRQTKNNKEEK